MSTPYTVLPPRADILGTCIRHLLSLLLLSQGLPAPLPRRILTPPGPNTRGPAAPRWAPPHSLFELWLPVWIPSQPPGLGVSTPQARWNANEWVPSALIPGFETIQFYSGDKRSEAETGAPSTSLKPDGEAGTALIPPQPRERFLIQLSQLSGTRTEGEAQRGRKTWQRSAREDKEAEPLRGTGRRGPGRRGSRLEPGAWCLVHPAVPLHAVSHGPRLHLLEERHR